MADSDEHPSAAPGVLKPETIDRHRAITSIREELEAVDLYDQRVDAAKDDELRALLAHNRDEEKEHAMMLLEWLRRKNPVMDEMMRTYLFVEGDITAAEEAATDGQSSSGNAAGSLGIGSLKG
ncbi:MAG: ferritin-like domain-containing protein [Pseudomonadota bacterium]